MLSLWSCVVFRSTRCWSWLERGEQIKWIQWTDLVWQALSSLKPMRTFPFPNHKLFPETGKQEEGNKRKENLHMASSTDKKNPLQWSHWTESKLPTSPFTRRVWIKSPVNKGIICNTYVWSVGAIKRNCLYVGLKTSTEPFSARVSHREDQCMCSLFQSQVKGKVELFTENS